jgi:signal transduction histidine kinase
LTLLDHNGVILARSHDSPTWIGQALPEDSIRRAVLIHERGLAEDAGVDGVRRLYAFTPVTGPAGGQIFLTLGYPLPDIYQDADQALVRELRWLGLILLLTLATIWIGSWRLILNPLGRLMNATQQLAQGKLAARSQVRHDQSEIGRLAWAFDEMAGALQQFNAELEERVAQRTAELERSLKELDQFTYIASHDLKAPLRGVKQLSSWIVEDAGDHLPEASKVHLAKMQSRIERMERLLDDLLMYSRVGRSYYGKVESVDTGLLVQEIIDLVAPPPGFTMVVQEPMPVLATSRILLELIFKNLIENAIKHHDRADGRVEVSAVEWEDEVEFSVTDDGRGIDGQFHERIFQIFQTLQPRDKIETTGVGLAIVKKAVESQGGTIRIISAEGQGTTFRFTWPNKAVPLSLD